MRLSVTVGVAALLLGCTFDPSGVPGEVAGDGGRGGDALRGPGTDARAVDATPAACLDGDGDQFQTVGVPGSECGDLLDCDDQDPLAYPGQPDYFDSPRLSGGYDYDCDGVETPVDTTEGRDCFWDWFDCAGTGWTDGVPGCGQAGRYHVCKSRNGRCREDAADILTMPCK